jgi:hypothetical protein
MISLNPVANLIRQSSEQDIWLYYFGTLPLSLPSCFTDSGDSCRLIDQSSS